MAKRYNLTEIFRLSKKRIFFDANILIYLFWPTNSSWERQYSTIYNRLLQQKNDMVVDFIVISEVINRAIRFEYDNYCEQNNIPKDDLPFKAYRDNQEGQEALDDIYQIVKRKIVNKFTIAGKSFTKTDIEGFLQNDGLDFSDKGIAALCKENDFVLLTNDKDFATVNVELLTSNPVLLITP